MKRFGSVLIGLGTALIAFSFVSGFLGAGQTFGLFPGLIVIFLGRAISRASRREEPEEQTQPQRPPARPRPVAVERTTPPNERRQPPKSDPVVEEILAAGRQLQEEIAPEVDLSPIEVQFDNEFRPMSSEEMVQRARKRWDSDR